MEATLGKDPEAWGQNKISAIAYKHAFYIPKRIEMIQAQAQAQKFPHGRRESNSIVLLSIHTHDVDKMTPSSLRLWNVWYKISSKIRTAELITEDANFKRQLTSC